MAMIKFISVDRITLFNKQPEGPRVVIVGPPERRKMVLRDAEPGRYSLVTRTDGPLYVDSATYGNRDLLRDDMEISQELASDPIQVEIRDGTSELTGSVRLLTDQSPISVFAISVEHPKIVEHIVATSDGRFSFRSLAPGRYRVLALRDAEEVIFRENGGLDLYLARALEVSVSSASNPTPCWMSFHEKSKTMKVSSFLLLLLVIFASQQTRIGIPNPVLSSISGLVINSITGVPIPEADVSLILQGPTSERQDVVSDVIDPELIGSRISGETKD
jgi:hypothetical protein